MARRSVPQQGDKDYDLDQRIDRLVTSPIFGLPIMLVILAAVFWVTIVGRQRAVGDAGQGPVLVRRAGCGAVHAPWACRGGSPALSGTASIAAWRGWWR